MEEEKGSGPKGQEGVTHGPATVETPNKYGDTIPVFYKTSNVSPDCVPDCQKVKYKV